MFLDTSGLLCYHHRSEPQHKDAVAFFLAASSDTLSDCNAARSRFRSLYNVTSRF